MTSRRYVARLWLSHGKARQEAQQFFLQFHLPLLDCHKPLQGVAGSQVSPLLLRWGSCRNCWQYCCRWCRGGCPAEVQRAGSRRQWAAHHQPFRLQWRLRKLHQSCSHVSRCRGQHAACACQGCCSRLQPGLLQGLAAFQQHLQLRIHSFQSSLLSNQQLLLVLQLHHLLLMLVNPGTASWQDGAGWQVKAACEAAGVAPQAHQVSLGEAGGWAVMMRAGRSRMKEAWAS